LIAKSVLVSTFFAHVIPNATLLIVIAVSGVHFNWIFTELFFETVNASYFPSKTYVPSSAKFPDLIG